MSGTHGTAVLTGPQAGLSVPADDCDSAYQVRVLATNANGKIVGVAGNGSILELRRLQQGGLLRLTTTRS